MSDFSPSKTDADYACRYGARPCSEFLLKDGTRQFCFEDRLTKDGARVDPGRVSEKNKELDPERRQHCEQPVCRKQGSILRYSKARHM